MQAGTIGKGGLRQEIGIRYCVVLVLNRRLSSTGSTFDASVGVAIATSSSHDAVFGNKTGTRLLQE